MSLIALTAPAAEPAAPAAEPAAPAAEPTAPAAEPAARRKVTVGPRYGASGLHAAMLGRGYRALWTTPIEAEVLDLRSEAGGLEPVRRVGGQQTKGLALRGPDGRSYTFRAIDKDPTSILPEELQDTFVEDLVQDQMAAQHPAAALVADELAKAAGVPTVPTRIVVLPDDDSLGEFRKEYAGLVGTLSEYPTPEERGHPGFDGAVEIIDHTTLYQKLAQSPDERADVREFLRARLFDVFISDFDRHRKQWRWAKRPGSATWHPIPEDRDQAFARYEGALVRAAAGIVPQLRRFGPGYDRMMGLTYNGREQDRSLLPALPHEAWGEVARELQARLTDEALERAARRMPAEWQALDGRRLVEALKKRRDTLPQAAERYYRHLAGQVDVQATDVAEEARVRRLPDGAIEVDLARRAAEGAPQPAPYFHRRFVPGETEEVRLYLRGGDDRVLVSGRKSPIGLRVVGGAGSDMLDDHEGGHTRFYDSEGDNSLVRGPGSAWDKGGWVAPPGPKNAPWIPPRDWGRDWFGVPWLSFGSDSGLFLGGGFTTLSYGFRQLPYASRQTLRAGWAFKASQPRVEYDGVFHPTGSGATLGLLARFSGLEIQRFYGYGNESTAEAPDNFYKVRHKQVVVAPQATFPLVGGLDLTLAPVMQYAVTEEGQRLVDLAQPYGAGHFGQVGGWGRLRLDSRRGVRVGGAERTALPVFGSAGYPASGVLLEARGGVYPALWDVRKAYGFVEGSAATYLTAGSNGRATLALRAGGRQMTGGGRGSAAERFPFFNLASLGGGGTFSGSDTLRGFAPNRFIGNRSVYANADLRLYLSRFFFALPGEWGLLGFGDVGRVWLDGEGSDTWHTSWGGGLWIGLLSRSNAVSFTFGQSDERTAFYVRAGFSF